MLRHYTPPINLNVIPKIEEDLQRYDLISMVFLLYDENDAAFNSLLLLEQMGDVGDVLRSWAEDALQYPNWKERFLESLCTCQLYKVIVKLGLDLTGVKMCISLTSYIDPMKKVLYKLCEHMTEDNFEKFKKALSTYNIDVMDYQSCERVLLKLIIDSFITVNHATGRQCEYKIEILAKIIDHIPGLKAIAKELRDTRDKFCPTILDTTTKITHNGSNEPVVERFSAHDFNEEFNILGSMDIELSSDSKHLGEDMYPIKNPQNIGACYIINEEHFFPSRDSIANSTLLEPLEDRHGSTRDKELLQNTMSSLNFRVLHNDNLDHVKLYEHIRYVIRNKVNEEDSVFMLCILSHGVKDCIFAVDSVKVSVKEIQNLIGEELYKRRIDIPKVMIIQACRKNEIPSNIPEKTHDPMNEFQHDGAKCAASCQDKVVAVVSDGSMEKAKKADFLICWATSPELYAYRSLIRIQDRTEYAGSIFIKYLCDNIQKHANKKHLSDILVKVNLQVADFFTMEGWDQFSMNENYLTKDLYLQIPKHTNHFD